MNRINLLLLFAAPTVLPAQTPARRFEIIVDSVVKPAMRSRQIPGAAIGIVQNGALVFAKGYGVTNLQTRRPVRPETIFQIASTTKPFTAAIVMQLVREGKLQLDAPVRTYLPWLADKYSPVTIRQLLHHTSGVRYDLRRQNVDEFSIEEFKARLDTAPLAFPAGERWQYSNTGYTLLALAVEAVTGKEFGAVLNERIFQPLGLRNTRYRVPKQADEAHATGYDLVGDTLQEAPHVFSGWGNSGIESSVVDVAKWVLALERGQLIPDDVAREMEQPGKLTNGQPIAFEFAGAPSSYGMGWFITRVGDRHLITHGGAVAGFNSVVNRFGDLTIIVLSNGKQGTDRIGQANFLADAIFTAIMDRNK